MFKSPKANITSRRFVLINPEQSLNENVPYDLQYRIWPHLGLLYVGTVAHEEGYEVVLHDELVQGYANLEKLVRPGDVVGLSLVSTGMQRGIELAYHAKALGAAYVIAGNDAATFRASQILGIRGKPIDVIATTNSLTAIRTLLRHLGTIRLEDMRIPGIAIVPSGVNRSNEVEMLKAEQVIRIQLTRTGETDPQDVFIVPKLDLYSNEYWELVWTNYREVFGHKHGDPASVRNALTLFAQGCTRTAGSDVCSYCGIADVADIRTASRTHLKQLLDGFSSFGINYIFNTTDSVFEMRAVAHDLRELGGYFSEGMMLYGRAAGLASQPDLIDEWLSLTGGRLLINVGMDSGDERVLSLGVSKASRKGSRLDENYQAVRNIASSGAHLHYSLIFGSPGETRESCERSLKFFEWSRDVLGTQLDQCETDIYWLNYGAPASKVFHDYAYAQRLAALSGKEIPYAVWQRAFYKQRDELVVPWSAQEAWYHWFTSITVEEAQEYNAHVSRVMATHEAAAPGRAKAFKPS